jgi:hypothetical protein
VINFLISFSTTIRNNLSKFSATPANACIDGLVQYIDDKFLPFGYGFTVIGIIAHLGWFIQYGLCCRKKKGGKKGKGNDQVTKADNTQKY